MSEAAYSVAMPDDSDRFRLDVVSKALQLFSEQGYEATSVDEIAEAAGISRRTFFRQFRSKEDVVFADHEILLEQASALLAAEHADPWSAVCDAALIVYERFSGWNDVARRRYAVVHEVPALRDREIVTIYRYERLFVEYLRRAVPEADELVRVQFAASVIATHNHLLRRMVRDGARASSSELRSALADIRRRLDHAPRDVDDDVVVAVFPRGLSASTVVDVIRQRLEQDDR